MVEREPVWLQNFRAFMSDGLFSDDAKWQSIFLEQVVSQHAEIACLQEQVEAANADRERWYASSFAATKRAEAAEAERDRLREAQRGHWHGVFLDGRNEHGCHTLMLPQRSIELEQDSNGDFLKAHAETILGAAEALGFEVGDAVVATFDLCLDEGFFSHYEFVEVSADLTAALYGTPHEQSTARAALQKESRL